MARAALQLVRPGKVLDIASGDGLMAELLAPRATAYVCIDSSAKIVSAARVRLEGFSNVDVQQGDMHALGMADDHFDLVLLMNALTYAERPQKALNEAVRVLKPGGQLLATTLAKHAHKAAVAPFNHANLGFDVGQLTSMAKKAGLSVTSCGPISRERRPPHFDVLSLLGDKS